MSLLLSNIVIAIVLQGYLFIQKVVFKLEERFTLMQKADVVEFYLRQDIQFSGYKGCRSCDNSLLDINHVRGLNQLALKEQALIVKNVFPGCKVKEFPKKIAEKIIKQEIKANTELLFVKDIHKATHKLAKPIQNPCAVVEIKDPFDLPDGALLAIADPKSIERFIASSVIGGKHIYRQLPENNDVCLQRTYELNAEILVLQWVVYYLAKKIATNETYTLYRDDVINNAEGLIDGIEDFYVHLIHDSKEQAKIIGAEIGVLLRTDGNFFGSQSFIWRDKTRNFADGYLRFPVVFTMAVRNVC